MKTKEEVLDQDYITAKDMQIIIPNLTYDMALSYIRMLQEEMKEKKYFVPKTKEKIVLTKLFKKKFGL